MDNLQTVKDFLIRENIKIPLAEMWVDPQRQRLSSLCYLERRGEILLLLRNKEPFSNFWTAPGGKLEPGEDPRQAIIREIREETGLELINPRLRMISSETGAGRDYNWLLFVFRATKFRGTLGECDEGILNWTPFRQLDEIEVSNADRSLLPLIMDDNQRYFVRLHYDDRHQVASMQKFPM